MKKKNNSKISIEQNQIISYVGIVLIIISLILFFGYFEEKNKHQTISKDITIFNNLYSDVSKFLPIIEKCNNDSNENYCAVAARHDDPIISNYAAKYEVNNALSPDFNDCQIRYTIEDKGKIKKTVCHNNEVLEKFDINNIKVSEITDNTLSYVYTTSYNDSGNTIYTDYELVLTKKDDSWKVLKGRLFFNNSISHYIIDAK